MIVIVDYGLGNLGSIANMLRKIGQAAMISGDLGAIADASKLILPGVGAFDRGVVRLRESGIQEALKERVLRAGVPILGICLGMQLMTRRSEEGNLPGLGWIDAETVRFRFDRGHGDLKIPHMGWNTVRLCKSSDLVSGTTTPPRFYFVHSYHVVCSDEGDVMARTHHGYEFVSGFQRGNITGVQFHPEKSHKYGMAFLKSWSGATPC